MKRGFLLSDNAKPSKEGSSRPEKESDFQLPSNMPQIDPEVLSTLMQYQMKFSAAEEPSDVKKQRVSGVFPEDEEKKADDGELPNSDMTVDEEGFGSIPFIYKFPDNAVLALNNWFAKRKDFILKDTSYIAWKKPGCPQHNPQFSCIFMCPISNEIFPASPLENQKYIIGEGSDGNDELVPIVWYPKKKLAKEAAAARAFSCLEYRYLLEESGLTLENDDNPVKGYIFNAARGLERETYEFGSQPEHVTRMLQAIRNELADDIQETVLHNEKLLVEWRAKKEATLVQEEQVEMEEDKRAEEKEAYRKSRLDAGE